MLHLVADMILHSLIEFTETIITLQLDYCVLIIVYY